MIFFIAQNKKYGGNRASNGSKRRKKCSVSTTTKIKTFFFEWEMCPEMCQSARLHITLIRQRKKHSKKYHKNREKGENSIKEFEMISGRCVAFTKILFKIFSFFLFNLTPRKWGKLIPDGVKFKNWEGEIGGDNPTSDLDNNIRKRIKTKKSHFHHLSHFPAIRGWQRCFWKKEKKSIFFFPHHWSRNVILPPTPKRVQITDHHFPDFLPEGKKKFEKIVTTLLLEKTKKRVVLWSNLWGKTRDYRKLLNCGRFFSVTRGNEPCQERKEEQKNTFFSNNNFHVIRERGEKIFFKNEKTITGLKTDWHKRNGKKRRRMKNSFCSE